MKIKFLLSLVHRSSVLIIKAGQACPGCSGLTICKKFPGKYRMTNFVRRSSLFERKRAGWDDIRTFISPETFPRPEVFLSQIQQLLEATAVPICPPGPDSAVRLGIE